jgi:hypothetical protein
VLGCCGVLVGVFTFTEARPAKTSLIGSLAAIAFALPVMRSALPRSPPLGVEGISVGWRVVEMNVSMALEPHVAVGLVGGEIVTCASYCRRAGRGHAPHQA